MSGSDSGLDPSSLPQPQFKEAPTNSTNPYWPFFKHGVRKYKTANYYEAYCKSCLENGNCKALRGEIAMMWRHLRKCRFFAGIIPPFPSARELQRANPVKRYGHILFRKEFERKYLEKNPETPKSFVTQLSICAYQNLSDAEKKKYDDEHKAQLKEKTRVARAKMGLPEDEEESEAEDDDDGGEDRRNQPKCPYWPYFKKGLNQFMKSRHKEAFCKACLAATGKKEPVRANGPFMLKHLLTCQFISEQEKATLSLDKRYSRSKAKNPAASVPSTQEDSNQKLRGLGYLAFRKEFEPDYLRKHPNTPNGLLMQMSRIAYYKLPSETKQRYNELYQQMKAAREDQTRNKRGRIRQAKIPEEKNKLKRKKATKRKVQSEEESSDMDSVDDDDQETQNSDSAGIEDQVDAVTVKIKEAGPILTFIEPSFTGLPATLQEDFQYSVSGTGMDLRSIPEMSTSSNYHEIVDSSDYESESVQKPRGAKRKRLSKIKSASQDLINSKAGKINSTGQNKTTLEENLSGEVPVKGLLGTPSNPIKIRTKGAESRPTSANEKTFVLTDVGLEDPHGKKNSRAPLLKRFPCASVKTSKPPKSILCNELGEIEDLEGFAYKSKLSSSEFPPSGLPQRGYFAFRKEFMERHMKLHPNDKKDYVYKLAKFTFEKLDPADKMKYHQLQWDRKLASLGQGTTSEISAPKSTLSTVSQTEKKETELASNNSGVPGSIQEKSNLSKSVLCHKVSVEIEDLKGVSGKPKLSLSDFPLSATYVHRRGYFAFRKEFVEQHMKLHPNDRNSHVFKLAKSSFEQLDPAVKAKYHQLQWDRKLASQGQGGSTTSEISVLKSTLTINQPEGNEAELASDTRSV